jgi:hypothetical protein
MSVKSRADILAEIGTLLADNTNGDVSLGDFRTVFQDITDSCLNTTTDTGTTGAYEWDGATQYYTNQITNYNGNWYIANTDPTLDGVFHDAEWDALSNNIYKATLSLSAAQVKLLFTTPQTIVSAVAGKSILVVSSSVKLTYGTVAFATNTSPYLYTDTATISQSTFTSTLAATVSRTVCGLHTNYSGALGATDTQLIDNKALKVTCSSDPTAGDSTVIFTVYYLLV